MYLSGSADTANTIVDHLEHTAKGTHETHTKELFEKHLNKAAQSVEKTMSTPTKVAIVGGSVALLGALGYWAFRHQQEKAANQQNAGEALPNAASR